MFKCWKDSFRDICLVGRISFIALFWSRNGTFDNHGKHCIFLMEKKGTGNFDSIDIMAIKQAKHLNQKT